MGEHRVKVGKYEFVLMGAGIVIEGGPETSGLALSGWQQDAYDALRDALQSLDAARVVVHAARDTVEAVRARRDRGESFDPQYYPLAIADALALHDSLTPDREPPSAWCGVEQPAAPEPTPAVGYLSEDRLAQIARVAAANVNDHALISSLNSRDLQLLVGELQRRRGHDI